MGSIRRTTTPQPRGGEFLLGLNKEVRQAAGVEARSTPAGSRRPRRTTRASGASRRRSR